MLQLLSINFPPVQLTGRVIVDGTIGTAELADGSVTNPKLANDAVTTNKIKDGAVTDVQIASVDGSKLTNGSVPVGKLNPLGFSDGIQLDGTVKHTNSVTAGTRNGITFDAQGHITATAALDTSDIPIATASNVGGISVPAASGLTVTATGAIDHADTISAGTGTKVTFNSHGHITATSLLS